MADHREATPEQVTTALRYEDYVRALYFGLGRLAEREGALDAYAFADHFVQLPDAEREDIKAVYDAMEEKHRG